MKIKHLLEYVFPKIQNVEVKTKRHPGRAAAKSDDVKYIGGGNFSDAWHNPQTTPHDVRKVSKGHGRSEIDGFYFYMLELEKHADNTNPYFPRFRGIKIYTDTHDDDLFGKDPRRDHITYSAQMEKLIDMRELSKSEEAAILFRIFGDRQHRKPAASKYIEEFLSGSQPYDQKILGILRIVLRDSRHGRNKPGLFSKIVDEDLKNAIKFLRTVHKTHSLGYDLHDENIMIRRTPYGPQLVILDPFSWQR